MYDDDDEGGWCHHTDNDTPGAGQRSGNPDRSSSSVGAAPPLVTKEGETFPKLNEDTNPGHPASSHRKLGSGGE